QPQAALRGGRFRRPPGQPVRRQQEGQRADGAYLQPPVRPAHHRPALLHRVRSLGPARHGAVPVHPPDPGRRADRRLQPWSPQPRLHLHRRHRRGRAAHAGPGTGTRPGLRPAAPRPRHLRRALPPLQHRQPPPGGAAALHRGDRGGARPQGHAQAVAAAAARRARHRGRRRHPVPRHRLLAVHAGGGGRAPLRGVVPQLLRHERRRPPGSRDRRRALKRRPGTPTRTPAMTQKEPHPQPRPDRQREATVPQPEPERAAPPELDFERIYRRARERVRRATERPLRHAIAALALGGALAASAPAQALQEGFGFQQVLQGLNLPTSVEFARDGRIFVTEQRGVVKVFDSILDPAPDVFADLRTQVHAVGDRGLLGLALHPDFPDQPYVYVTYAYDGGKGANDHPRWGGVDTDFDECVELVPNGGCPIVGRLSRLTASGNTAVEEVVLIEDWYQQFRFHSIGMAAVGPDGMLYVSAGEGALSESVDYGQFPSPPYDDTGSPPGEGGSLRVQDLDTDGDPLGLNGTIIRVDPMTGAAAPGNPLYDVPGMPENGRRMLAYGMRNPFRFAFRPGTDEIWTGDVGETRFEEINIVPGLADNGGTPRNFGWPCYEGPDPHPNWVFAE